MLFLRRKPKEGRAALDEFLAAWEKLEAFDPRERRDPAGRLADFLNTIPPNVENGKRLLAEAGGQGTSSSVDYLMDVVSRLPVVPSGREQLPAEPDVPWEKLESEAGPIARVVNRFRVQELAAVSGPGRERVDRLRNRVREIGRWADPTEYAGAMQELEAAVAELDRTLAEHDKAHPEFRQYLNQLSQLGGLRDAGFKALVAVAPPEGLAVIVEALSDPKPERVQLALDVLLARGWQPTTIDEKLDWLCAQARRPDLRAKALAELSKLVVQTTDPVLLVDVIEPRFAREGLTDLQEEGLPDLRAGLLEHIAALGGERAASRLVAVLESHTEPPSLKVTVIRLLARSNAPESVRLLTDAMSSVETEVRTAATQALAEVRTEPGTPDRAAVLDRLVFALRDGEPVVRDAAVESLRKYPDATGQLVQTLLEDRNPAARESAARTFASGLSPDAAATDALTRALSDEDAAVRRAAAEALASQSRMPSDPEGKLRYLAARQDWRGVRQAGRAAIPQLVPLLKDRDETVRLEVVKVLGSLRERAVASEVSHLLSDASQEVRRQAAVALAALGDSSQAAALRTAMAKEGFEEVRKEMESAIRRLEKA
ncbi:MAG TPA: HEAT repeat domain-containing protein [bacterium]|nr:HEAT repeat domain-containing protein [bacterium]